MIEAVIFDMDGVLLDSEPLHDGTNIQMLSEWGITIDEKLLHQFVGRTSHDLWAAMKNQFNIEEDIDVLVDKQWAMNIKNLPQTDIVASDGLDALLGYIQQNNLSASVASSSRGDFVEAVFDHLNLWPYMDAYTGGGEVSNGKPHPEIYLKAASKVNISPDKCVAIEDSTAGVASARAAGMITIGYANPTSKNQDISAAEYIVTHLMQVCAVIDDINSQNSK